MGHPKESPIVIGTYDGQAGYGIRRDALPVSECPVCVSVKRDPDDRISWIELTGNLPQNRIRVSAKLPPGAVVVNI